MQFTQKRGEKKKETTLLVEERKEKGGEINLFLSLF